MKPGQPCPYLPDPMENYLQSWRPCGRRSARVVCCVGGMIAALALPPVAMAQPYVSTWQRFGAGDGQYAGASYRTQNACGQAEAGTMAAGAYRVRGGFWPGVLVERDSQPQPDVTITEVLPGEALPGATLTVRGQIAAGAGEVGVYWEQAGGMRMLAAAQPERDGAFTLQIQVPVEAAGGPALLMAGPTAGSSPHALAVRSITVSDSAPASIAGAVQNAAGGSVGAGFRVRLRNHSGHVLAESSTDAGGRYLFAGLVPGRYIVEPLADGYAPEAKTVGSGGAVNFVAKPSSDPWTVPPCWLVNAGAIALPGGLYKGPNVAQVGDWTQTPFAQLVSLPGKGQPPLTVRVWAEVKRGTLTSLLPLKVDFALLTSDDAVVAQHLSEAPALVHPSKPYDAFFWDINSFELPPGKLRLRIRAVTQLGAAPATAGRGGAPGLASLSGEGGNSAVVVPTLPAGWIITLSEWEYPVTVEGLGDRWFSNWSKNRSLSITQEDPFNLRYSYKGVLPNLPGFGNPLWSQPIDLDPFLTLENSLNTGVTVAEWFRSDGAWSGSAMLQASLTLLGQALLGGSKPLSGPAGSSLSKSSYSLNPAWKDELPEVKLSVWGAGLPEPIEICGYKFGGDVGVFFTLSGEVSVAAKVENDLRLTATVTPAVKVGLPAEASLEFGVCGASADITPEASLGAPIELDPAKSLPVEWKGLCFTLSGTASASVHCCGVVNEKTSVDLFKPIHVGNCSAPQGLHAAGAAVSRGAPPPHASVAVSPLGYAIAVWDQVVSENGVPRRTAPVYSLFNRSQWSDPAPVAGDTLAGWEPQVVFIGPARVLVTWVRPRSSGARTVALQVALGAERPSSLAALGLPQAVAPQSLCEDVVDAVAGVLCGIVQFGADVVSAIGDAFSIFSREAPLSMKWQLPRPVVDDPLFDLRPVLAGDFRTGQALLVWLREQDVPAGQQPLALYQASFVDGAWSLPTRLDPDGRGMDLQPSVRFDREGNPAVVWMRDLDADLTTAHDRQLRFTSRRQGWALPETLGGAPASPWTPSLDFDLNNQPAVAFVVPPNHPLTGKPLPADGHLGFLHLARRTERGWSDELVDSEVRAERPILRIGPDNRALVMFRSFGVAGIGSSGGGIACGISDLSAPDPIWNIGSVTRGGRSRQLALDVDPETGQPVMFWESRDATRADGEPVLVRQQRPVLVDLAFGEEGLSFSSPRPNPGERVGISARVVNLGFRRFENAAAVVSFYDREPNRGAVPFAIVPFGDALGFGESAVVTASYLVSDRAERSFYAVVAPGREVQESDGQNNLTTGRCGGVPEPVGLTAIPFPLRSAVRLSWTSSITDGSVRHWIWRQTGNGPFRLLGSTRSLEFTDLVAAPGQTSIYQVVTAEDGSGLASAAASAAADVARADSSAGPGDVRLHVNFFGGAAHLSWNALPGVQLEVTDALDGGRTVWSPVTDPVSEVGGSGSFSQAAGVRTRFFRLAKH